MNFLRLILAFNICLVAYFGTFHSLDHSFDFNHDTNCLECLALNSVGNGQLGDEIIVEFSFEIYFEELVLVSQSTSIEYIGNLPLSRGPPSGPA